jgi:hypothetical protein
MYEKKFGKLDFNKNKTLIVQRMKNKKQTGKICLQGTVDKGLEYKIHK